MANATVHLLAIIDTRPEHLETVRQALRAAQAEARKEDGCEHYAFHADLAQPTRLYAIERWRDQAALDVHAKGTALQALAGVLDGRASLDIRTLEPLA